MGEELVWSWKESEMFQQWFLYSADLKFVGAVTSPNKRGISLCAGEVSNFGCLSG